MCSSMLLGIDTSFANYRPDGVPTEIDWERAINSRQFSFVYGRQGMGVNPGNLDGNLFTTTHDECKKRGMPFGPYFFFMAHQDGKAQAQLFLENIAGREGDLRPMVDVEEDSFRWHPDVSVAITNLAVFNEVVEQALKTKVIIYTNNDTWSSFMGNTDSFRGHDLWQAEYHYDPHHLPAPIRGFNKFLIYQYSDRGSIPGMMGDVDLDALYGSLDLLKR